MKTMFLCPEKGFFPFFLERNDLGGCQAFKCNLVDGCEQRKPGVPEETGSTEDGEPSSTPPFRNRCAYVGGVLVGETSLFQNLVGLLGYLGLKKEAPLVHH